MKSLIIFKQGVLMHKLLQLAILVILVAGITVHAFAGEIDPDADPEKIEPGNSTVCQLCGQYIRVIGEARNPSGTGTGSGSGSGKINA